MESRIDLAKYFNKLGFKKGAEIGVADGRYSKILLENVINLEEFYGIDLWAPYEGSWRTDNSQEKAYDEAKGKVSNYNYAKLIKKTSLEASLDFEDGYFDFVFIDGAHDFDNAMLDIILWSKKVRKGGIVSGHDYCHFSNSGVIEAVNKYCEIHRIELKLINRNEKNFKDDRQPCWWFIKK